MNKLVTNSNLFLLHHLKALGDRLSISTRKIFFIFFIFFSFSSYSQVKLPKLISDGMVLQRNTHVKIWGWAANNEEISIDFNHQVYHTCANTIGEWQIILPELKAGGPFNMTIKASNTIAINDIMIGDVWLCSGQSNMEYPMERLTHIYGWEIAASANTNIREFIVPQKYDFHSPQTDLQSGKWQTTNPTSILKFSAISYFFANELYKKYHVPIGLINASLGGSPAEAWISEDAIRNFPLYYQDLQRFKDNSLIQKIDSTDNIRSKNWYKLLRSKDEGYKDLLKPWYSLDLITSDWAEMNIPGYWRQEPIGAVNGVVWFRKEINLAADLKGKQALLAMGRIVDADSVFINGAFIGTTGYQYPQRRYNVPANILREGKNTIVVRVINNSGNGGFVLDKPYELLAGDIKIDLKGMWKYKLGAKMDPMPGQTTVKLKPVGLYNAMIAPLENYAIKGAIWYQGESNTGRAVEYRTLFPALINDWRNHWKQGDFPFLYVQLPNFMEEKEQPSESDWAMLREAQLKALSLPHTGMVVAIDLGEWNDIHPVKKQEVGYRLALSAQYVAYGDHKTIYSGPTYQSMKIEGNKIVLTFTNVGSGLVTKGDSLKRFAIAGSDRKFVWAKARIEKNKVMVWSEKVPLPIAVRYAWADNPFGANLYNKEGLPASPFRTDVNKDTCSPAPVKLTADQDHTRLMNLLHITALRPGPSGNATAPNHANSDESKATTYTSLPDPLILKNGKKVTSAAIWNKQRRAEIFEDFDSEVYGRQPKNTPKVTWEVLSQKNDSVGNIPVVEKKLIGRADNSSYPCVKAEIQLTLTVPANAKGPVPVILEFGFDFSMFARPVTAQTTPAARPVKFVNEGLKQVIEKGWGFAVIIPASYQEDNGAGLTQGIIGLVNKGQPRKVDDWGTLRAWAWGASRALDYFETDKSVNAKQVGIEGLSRYGKAAIVTLAYDQRFAIGFIASSGEGGVKLHRRTFGEQVESLASTGEYHWMAGNFLKYAGPLTPNDLPVDSHELVALCAPRPVFISFGVVEKEGNWLDDKGMFLGGVYAEPVYKLLGKKGMGVSEMPPAETALIDGDIAFRQHNGGHTAGPNWPTFITFASKYFK